MEETSDLEITRSGTIWLVYGTDDSSADCAAATANTGTDRDSPPTPTVWAVQVTGSNLIASADQTRHSRSTAWASISFSSPMSQAGLHQSLQNLDAPPPSHHHQYVLLKLDIPHDVLHHPYSSSDMFISDKTGSRARSGTMRRRSSAGDSELIRFSVCLIMLDMYPAVSQPPARRRRKQASSG